MLNRWPPMPNMNKNHQVQAHQLIEHPSNAPIASQSSMKTERQASDSELTGRTKESAYTGTTGVKLVDIALLRKTLPKNQFHCANCSYVAKRKHTLTIHMKQHCIGINVSKETIKNKTCRICQKMFTHDGLRSHLRGFIKNRSRRIRGIHKNFDVEYHEIYLDEIRFRP